MTLRDNIYDKIQFEVYVNESNCVDGIQYASNSVEKIADEFAVGFALWKESNVLQDENGMYYSESRIHVSRNNPVDIHELLQIYKQENGL